MELYIPSKVLATFEASTLSGLEITLTSPETGPPVLNKLTEIIEISKTRTAAEKITTARRFNKTFTLAPPYQPSNK
jgi:hypothetical protein